jgi:hypothetical protein
LIVVTLTSGAPNMGAVGVASSAHGEARSVPVFSFGSLARLGAHFVVQLVMRVFRRAPQLPAFRASYDPDGLAPVTLEEREVLSTLSRCVACGACDAAFDAYGKVVRSEIRGPSELPLAYARSLPDLDATSGWLVHVSKADLARLERACPVDVPFTRVVATLRARAGAPRVRQSKAGRARHDPG